MRPLSCSFPTPPLLFWPPCVQQQAVSDPPSGMRPNIAAVPIMQEAYHPWNCSRVDPPSPSRHPFVQTRAVSTLLSTYDALHFTPEDPKTRATPRQSQGSQPLLDPFPCRSNLQQDCGCEEGWARSQGQHDPMSCDFEHGTVVWGRCLEGSG